MNAEIEKFIQKSVYVFVCLFGLIELHENVRELSG